MEVASHPEHSALLRGTTEPIEFLRFSLSMSQLAIVCYSLAPPIQEPAMTALRHLPDVKCERCGTLFRPRRAEQRFCSRSCWYSTTRTSEKPCACCGTVFKAKYAQQQYCSVECKVKGTTKNKTVICAECGTSFERPHGKTRAYCSRSCANKARAKGMKKPEIALDGRAIGDAVKSTNGYLGYPISVIDRRKSGTYIVQSSL